MTKKRRVITMRADPLPGVGSMIPGPFDGEISSSANEQRDSIGEPSAVRKSRRLSSRRLIESTGNAGGYGTDPNLITPHSPWPKILTLYERHLIDDLADQLLPAKATDPASSELRIADFFDDWLSAPYDTQVADRTQIRSGLMRVVQIAQGLFGDDFLQLSDAQKRSVVDQLIKNDDDDRKFFLRFRYLVIGGYFTADVGMRILGYRGNIPLRKPAQIPVQVMNVIESELKKLGL
jgi:hypothetical protein